MPHSRKLRRSSHGQMYIRHIILKGQSGDAEYVMVCVGYEILMALMIQVWSYESLHCALCITLCTPVSSYY
jgi:hypothetical protein